MVSFCCRLFIPGPVTVSRLGYKNNCPNSGLRTTQPNYKLLYKLPYLFSAYLLEDLKLFGEEWKLICNQYFYHPALPWA